MRIRLCLRASPRAILPRTGDSARTLPRELLGCRRRADGVDQVHHRLHHGAQARAAAPEVRTDLEVVEARPLAVPGDVVFDRPVGRGTAAATPRDADLAVRQGVGEPLEV